MILKFDHISYSCSNELDAARHTPVHYTESFRDVGLDNISCKMKYLKFKSIKHNIIMLVPNASDSLGVPIEITQYPEVDHGVENLSFKDNTIFWQVADVSVARNLFLSLGAKEADAANRLVLTPFLDKKKIFIHLVENPGCKREPFLDVKGFSSIGLFVDNVEKHLVQCADVGFQISDISQIKVQERWMNIAFVEGKNGELVELISIMKERN